MTGAIGLLVALLPVAGMCADATAAAQAAAGDRSATAALNPVVVTATRKPDDALLVPAAIDVIDREELRRARPRIDLSESLRRIPGVVARNRHNQAQDLQISIRGFGARSTFGVRGVRLFTDGIPATMPDGQGQVSHFPLQSAARIEVLRGPFSALYGNASGGVIELFTGAAPAVPHLKTGLVAGSDGLLRQALSWHGPWGQGDEGDALVDMVDVHSDGFRRHSASRRRSAQALLRGGFGERGRYTVLFNGLDLAADDPQGLNATQLQGDRRAASAGALAFDTRKTVRQQQAGMRLEWTSTQASVLALTAHAGNRKTFQMLSIPAFVQQRSALQGGGALDLDRDYSGLDARWRWRAQLGGGALSLTSGVQFERAEEHRLGFENFVGDRLGVVGALRRDERNQVDGQGVYLQADWTPAERWRVNTGLRRSEVRFRSQDRFVTADNPDDSGALEFSRTSPVAGVLFRARPWLSVYANAGAGFETPTAAELAYRSDGLSGLNDTLRPARSRNVEVGMRARRGDLEASATLFQSRTEDELVVVANSGGRSVYDNASLTRRRGFELAVSGRIVPGWHYATAYTYLDARYLEDFAVCAQPPCAADDLLIAAGRRIPGLSRHVAWGELRWTARPRLDLMLEGHAVDRIFVDDANSESAPAHVRFDFAAERRFRTGRLHWRAFARIENLFDREYVGSVIVNERNGRYYEPAPGRGWVLGVSASRAFD